MAQVINACAPQPSRCQSPNYPVFSTGISVRQIPVCGPSPCDCDTPMTGRYRVALGGTLDRSHWLEGWIYSQLVTRGAVACDEHTLGRSAGGWWADAFRGTGNSFQSGSKLWSLQWSRVTNEALIYARQYATEALQYLVQWGIASRIKVDSNYVNPKVMRLVITVIGPGHPQEVTVDGQVVPSGGWAWEVKGG